MEIPKHLAEVQGEQIIARTVRLLREAGDGYEIIVTSHDPRYEFEGCIRHEPINNIYEIDRFTDELIISDMCFLYGDTFYTEESISKILNTKAEDLLFFGNQESIVAVNIKDHILFRKHVADGNRETTFNIKSALVEEMNEDGIAILNMDDEILKAYNPYCKTIYYSLDNSDADIYASNISVTNEGTYFDIHWQDRVIKNVFCPMIGRPNIYNCLVGFAIGSINGADDELLVRAISKVNITYSLRQNHIKIGSYNLFVDCFNASYESIENDMKTMEDLCPDEGGRKIVVIGDVAELGEKAEEIHRRIGSMLASHKIDKFFVFGEYSDYVYQGLIESNPSAEVYSSKDQNEIEHYIKEYIKAGDLILWKASRDTHIELTIDNIFGTDYYPLYPNDYDIEAKVHTYSPIIEEGKLGNRYYRMGEPIGGLLGDSNKKGEFDYCNYENGIKFVRYNSKSRNAVIPNSIDGIQMRSIGDRAFYKGIITSVHMPDSVLNISTNAFLRCYDLRKVRLSENIKFIDYSAFAYCTALEKITIPESCLIIRRKAFYECKRLKEILIKGINTHLEEGVFLECDEVIIKCKSGSMAEEYAIEHGIKYILIDENTLENEMVIPGKKRKEIIINSISWADYKGKCRLNIEIKVDEKSDILWYEVDKKWKKFVCDDRIDAVVVSLLLFAIRGKYAAIKSILPISEKLKYQLEYHLIPQIVDFEGERNAIAVKIDAPTTNRIYEKTSIANGTGFSRGVDSFATLYEYGKNSIAPEDYKVNFLNVYNVGAFHGMDDGKRSYSLSRDLYREQTESTVKFAEEYGYNALVVDSNLALFIQEHFRNPRYGDLRKFQNTATERNIGTTRVCEIFSVN